MQITTNNDRYGLETFLRATRRRFWFLNGTAVLATAVSGWLLWSVLLLLWPHRPAEGWARWLWLLLPALLLGRAAWRSWNLWKTQDAGWSEEAPSLGRRAALGLLLLVMILVPSPPTKHLYLYGWLGGGVAALYLMWAFARLYRRAQTLDMAQQVEAWNPTASGYLTALELSRHLPELSEQPVYSSDLAEARIEEVQRAMAQISPTHVVPTQQFEARSLWLFAAAVLCFGSLLAAPQWTVEKIGALVLPPSAKIRSIARSEQKIVVADLVLTYRYPIYTGRSPRTIHNSDGSLFALKGTEVLIRARALEPLSRASMLINQKQRVPLTIGKDGRSVKGTIQLMKPGNYQFRFATQRGGLQKGHLRAIRIKKDRKPQISLTFPNKDMEVRVRQTVPVVYEYSDDFGVATIYLVYRNLSSRRFKKARRIKLKQLESPQKQGSDRSEWSLQSLPMGPGDRVAYFLEVHDNDAISGANKGRSRTRYIKIYSPLEQHDKLLKKQEKLLGQMVHFLGDLLEAPSVKDLSPSKIIQGVKLLNGKGGELLDTFKRILKGMRDDSLTKTYAIIAMENLMRRFQGRHEQRLYVTRRLILSTNDTTLDFPREMVTSQRVGELPLQEDDVYAMTMLLNRQRLDVLQNLAKQLSESQNRVQELLEDYRRNRNAKTKKALMRELQRLERLIRDINKRMQKLHRQIPDEYLNMQAFKNKSSMNKIKNLRKMISENKLEDAAKELSRLARNIEQMVSQMDRYSKEAGGQALQRMAAAMRQMIEKVQQLEQKQKRLSRRTRQVQREVAKRMQKAMKKKLQKMLEKQLKRANQMKAEMEKIRKQLGHDLKRYRMKPNQDRLEHRVQELQRMLKHSDVFESLQVLRNFRSQSRWYQYSMRRMERYFERQRPHRVPALKKSQVSMRTAQELAEKMQRDLEKIYPKPQPYMKPQDRQRMRRYSQQQEMLRQEVNRLRQKMQRMSRRMPLFKPSMQRGLRKASGQMGSAKGQLKRNSPRPAFGHQQRAISSLRKVRRQMSQSMKQQGKRRSGKGGKQGGVGSRRHQEKVKIPDPSAHKAPKALRQDILDALKEKFPHKYKERVHRYYEKLAK